jgi:mediator of RNA polymerase II transcription subunit 7
MAEESVISALYPPPPPYVKFFTPENEAKLQEYKKGNDEDLTKVEFKEDDKDLQFLIPPQQPEGETYRSFGEIWNFNDKIPKLEDMGISKLYKESNIVNNDDGKIESQHRISELKRLLKSLLLNFLETVGVMSVNPSEFAVKVEQIRTILINIHHLLNEYRPHQSRESLILLLEKQISTKRGEITEIEKVCKDVEEKIHALVRVYVDEEEEPSGVPEADKELKSDDIAMG